MCFERFTEMGQCFTILGYFPYSHKGNFAADNKLKSDNEENNLIIDGMPVHDGILREG